MKFLIGYDNGLKVEVVDGDLEPFLSSSLWKMRMPAARRRAMGFEGGSILFGGDLSAGDRQSVVEAFISLRKYGCEVLLDKTYEANESFERSIVYERASVGRAIKSHDSSISQQFQEYVEVVNGRMARPLRSQQMWDSFFLFSMRKSANFSVPGSGKTASTLGVYAFLKEKGLADRVVVICPKNAFGSWRSEWKSCFGGLDQCRPLSFHDEEWVSKKRSDRRKELLLNAARYNLILMNYESCYAYVDILAQLVENKTLLVFDEVHKVKRIGGMRAEDALEVASHAERIVALTGTPIPNSYCDLFNLLHMIFGSDYKRFFGYGPEALADPSPDMVMDINEKIQPFFCRTNKNQLGVPAAYPDSIREVRARPSENDVFLAVKKAYRKDPLALIVRILQLESDPRMLNESFELSDHEGIFDEVNVGGLPIMPPLGISSSLVKGGVPTAKTSACIDLVSELVSQGKTVVVWCFFKRSMSNIDSALKNLGIRSAQINGSIPQRMRDQILDSFKSGGLDVLITNPQTLAESVSLHSVCHDAVYFEYSYNLVHLLQSKDRIHRLGLPDGQYTQYHFLQTRFDMGDRLWSLDQRIYQRLKKKERVMLDAIDSGVLEAGFADEEDLAAVFKGLLDGYGDADDDADDCDTIENESQLLKGERE